MSVNTTVTVSFSEAMDATTVNGSTIELRDPSGDPVSATVSYDEGSFTARLAPIALLVGGTTYTATVKGGTTVPQVKDLAGNALAADVTWTFTVVGPLQVIPLTPAPNSPDVPTGVAPRAAFSKAIDPTTLTTSTVLLQDDTVSMPVPVTVSPGPNANAVAIVPLGPLQPQHNYTVTLKGGPNAPHVTDSTGIPLPADSSWSFTTADPPTAIPTVSIFAPTVTPGNPAQNDPAPAELGLKFRSDTDGLITGVRFYKGSAANGGTHVGHLWTIDGTQLGSVTFTTETATGWQQALFPAPILIKANTTYVVSYFAPQGHYAADNGYFASNGADNPPLHALQEGVDGSNGVFHSGESGFPTDTLNSTNYYVDVIFADPTLSAPQVFSTTPAPGATNVSTDFKPTVTFSELIDPLSLNDSPIQLTDTANNAVPFTWELDESGFTVTITPLIPLQPGQAYTMIVKGGPDSPHITDLDGMPLAADYAWSFTTEQPPSSLIGSENKSTQNYWEILRQVVGEVLTRYDVEILG